MCGSEGHSDGVFSMSQLECEQQPHQLLCDQSQHNVRKKAAMDDARLVQSPALRRGWHSLITCNDKFGCAMSDCVCLL
eukprot:4031159-Amphidinium_carterae.1